MVTWVSTKGMLNLRKQFDAAFPNRDHASDGTIGDYAHSQGTSGHNPDDTSMDNAEWDKDSDNVSEVRALDVDADLNETGVAMQNVIDHLRKLPNLSSVLRYMIHNRKIYRAATGWAPETYNGDNPHIEHAHFSGTYTNAADENSTFDFHLEDLVSLSPDDKTMLDQRFDAIEAKLAALPHGLWAFDPGSDDWAGVTSATYNLTDGDNGTVAPSTALESLLARRDNDRKVIDNLVAQQKDMAAKLDQILQSLV